MATKIRLQRHGRKSYAFYSIVIADSRAPRDGKFTEKIGTYNPNTEAQVPLTDSRAGRGNSSESSTFVIRILV